MLNFFLGFDFLNKYKHCISLLYMCRPLSDVHCLGMEFHCGDNKVKSNTVLCK